MTDIEKYLTTRGCELWPGVTFYLTDPKERAKAVQWTRDLLTQLEAVKSDLV